MWWTPAARQPQSREDRQCTCWNLGTRGEVHVLRFKVTSGTPSAPMYGWTSHLDCSQLSSKSRDLNWARSGVYVSQPPTLVRLVVHSQPIVCSDIAPLLRGWSSCLRGGLGRIGV